MTSADFEGQKLPQQIGAENKRLELPPSNQHTAKRAKTQSNAMTTPDDAAKPVAEGMLNQKTSENPESFAARPSSTFQRDRSGRSLPVLPWMRFPVEIESSGSVPLTLVRGCDARLLAILQQRMHLRARLSLGDSFKDAGLCSLCCFYFAP